MGNQEAVNHIRHSLLAKTTLEFPKVKYSVYRQLLINLAS